MLKVGLTGGIGSGKSLCGRVFGLLGIPVFNSDQAAKYILDTDHSLQVALRKMFGETYFLNTGLPDRKKLAELVFSEPSKLEQLNRLVHPAVFEAFSNWVRNQTKNSPYVIKEAAILYESGADKSVDCSILVYADQNLRLKRVLVRDRISAAQVLDRMARQMPEEEKLRRATFVLYNDDLHSVITQVYKLDEELKLRHF